MMNDEALMQCNETELLWMARDQGLGHLRRGIPKPELVAIVTGQIDVRPDHLSGTSDSRAALEVFIEKNWAVIRSQLPQCTGRCTKFQCTEGKHALCFFPNQDAMRSS